MDASKIMWQFVLGIWMMMHGAFAQNVDAVIAEFNASVGGNYKADHNRAVLIIEGFRNGELVKEDRVSVYDLDLETLSFSGEEQAVIIKCFSDLDGCVTRRLTRERSKKSYRKRILVVVEKDKSGAEIETKMRNLVTTMQNKY